MTPRQARIALAGFALLAGAVTYNALVRQEPAADDRRTGVPAAGKESGAKAAPAAKPKRTAAPKGDTTAATAERPETVRAIQRELSQRGYGALEADGAIGPITRAAIMAYEHDHRLPLTGDAGEELLKRLLLGAPTGAPAGSAMRAPSPQAEAIIRQVQTRLAERGYRPGAADGRLNAETVAAIRKFESDQGLAVKGRVSAEVLARLQDRASSSTVHAER